MNNGCRIHKLDNKQVKNFNVPHVWPSFNIHVCRYSKSGKYCRHCQNKLNCFKFWTESSDCVKHCKVCGGSRGPIGSRVPCSCWSKTNNLISLTISSEFTTVQPRYSEFLGTNKNLIFCWCGLKRKNITWESSVLFRSTVSSVKTVPSFLPGQLKSQLLKGIPYVKECCFVASPKEMASQNQNT